MREEGEEAGPPAPAVRGSWRSANVVLLGVVSMLTDTATEMAVPLLPVFLTVTLGAGALTLGWIEGAADATASVLKLIAGRQADRVGRQRPFVLGGYGLSSLVRPLLALASRPAHVLAVRMLDRAGKGIRTSPRDALIARSVEPGQHGAAFGLHRGMDHAGAVLGPLLAAAYLGLLGGEMRTLFALTAIPGAAAVAVIWLGVGDAPASASAPEPPAFDPAPAAPRASPAPLWRFLVPLGLFTLGNASDLFLLLKAGGTRAPLATLPLLWMGLHIVKALSSVPGGRLADRWGRRRTIVMGWLFYAAIYAALAFAREPATVAALFVAYGLYHGLTEGAERALVAEIAPPRHEGSAFGAYHVTLGLLALAASVLFGALWSAFGPAAAFLTSAGLALAAVVTLVALAPRPVGRPG